MVIVTNLRAFLIVGEGPDGRAVRLETFRLATDPSAFWDIVSTPRKSAERVGRAFGEFVKRAMTQSVALREPKNVAWFLASYARDALQRVEAVGSLPALANLRSSLEEALGVTFEAERGDHFFRSTLVQTLFYGVFSAWVLWARDAARSSPKFDWRSAIWHLTVPFIRTLFEQIASPTHLKPLGLVEVLDWTAATLNRVDAPAFFTGFNDADAVQFFYEPFLEAFDPELRRELGVWYTPSEVVAYMVARVDKALREDLGIADGLASEQVYVLDPCCGTGAFLAAVLRRIDASLMERGFGALRGQMVKKAALSRVFGFEIMPAPFVVAHLQVGLVLAELGATLDAASERPGVFLTNALTGWEPHVNKPLPFPELEQERAAADRVKQDAPILVILGNPPYNGFAGVSEGEEERRLTEAYKRTKSVRRPEGQGLNDPYVRFFRMAERRIADKTGQGIVCFISNYSWLDGLSFTGMRERYLDAFDAIRIDCLNGDKYKTGKTTPDGAPDPSIFSTEHNREGIQVGTAIATLIRKPDHAPARSVEFRQVWGVGKRRELLDTAEAAPSAVYAPVTPPMELRLPYMPLAYAETYLQWPLLPELLPSYFAGVQTKRDLFLIDIERDVLEKRINAYFDPSISDSDVARLYPEIWMKTRRYNPGEIRKILISRRPAWDNVVMHAYRPFDIRWIYWESKTKLLGEKSPDYWPHAWHGNPTLSTQQKPRGEWQSSQVVQSIACLDLIDRGSSNFPLELAEIGSDGRRPNLSQSVSDYLASRSLPFETAFRHIVAVLHAPAYGNENAGALRMDWPRVPFPERADTLRASADLGATLATLLDPETAAQGVSTGTLRIGQRTLALPTKRGGGGLELVDLALTAGWGSTQGAGSGNTIVMPGRGLTVPRPYTEAERAALDAEGQALGLSSERTFALLGDRTFDIYLNRDAWWSNVPERVWDYTLGGYQVVKKWLSYRERSVLGRALKPAEAAYVAEMVRRIAAIQLIGPALDANYAAAKADAVPWKDGRPYDRGCGDDR